MRKEKLITVGVIITVLLIAGGVIFFKNTGFASKEILSEEVARYIGENSVLYVQTGCIHCKEQENLFGINVKYLNMVDCLEDTEACINARIEATPTWIINGQKYVGVQSIETLKELTKYKE